MTLRLVEPDEPLEAAPAAAEPVLRLLGPSTTAELEETASSKPSRWGSAAIVAGLIVLVAMVIRHWPRVESPEAADGLSQDRRVRPSDH